jgi:hypothetical protein
MKFLGRSGRSLAVRSTGLAMGREVGALRRLLGSSVVVAVACGTACGSALASGRPGIHQLPGGAGCVTVAPHDGCGTVHGIGGKASWTVSADGLNLYGVADDGGSLISLRRERRGGFRQLSGGQGCLSADELPDCLRTPFLTTGTYVRLVLSSDGGAGYLLDDTFDHPLRVISLLRDPATGALRVAERQPCVSSADAAGCTPVAGLATNATLFDAVESTDTHDLYVSTSESIVHLRRDADGGLQHASGQADCFARAGGGCRPVPAIPSNTDDAQLVLSADGRNLYASFSGHEATGGNGNIELGAILEFSRAADSGALVPLGRPDACVSSFVVAKGCTAWSVLHVVIDDLALASNSLGYAASLDLQEGRESLAALRRDVSTGILVPVAGPGACWGRPDDPDELGKPSTRRGEPCRSVREWRAGALAGPPLITNDGRNVYVLTEAWDNFADLPTRYGDSALVDFARDPQTGRLARLSGARGCLGADQVHSCSRLAPRFIVEQAVEAAGGRAVALVLSGPPGGGIPRVTLRLLARERSSRGRLSPIHGPDGCATPTRARACGRIRGLPSKWTRREPPADAADEPRRHLPVRASGRRRDLPRA